MRVYLHITLFLTLFTRLVNAQDCNENINKLPMYGNVKKCAEQITADNKFLAYCDEHFKTRKDAALKFINRAWDYVYSHKLDTAMMRFNQAWLLDSSNANIYWGFGNLYGMKGKFKESLPYFEKALKLKDNDPKLWFDASTSYGSVYFQTKNKKYLDSTIYALKKAITNDAKNGLYYGQLTTAYFYTAQRDSAKKYLNITDKFDPKYVSQQIRIQLQ